MTDQNHDHPSPDIASKVGRAGIPGRIQDFIFARELAEVYLLLDNVSTSANKRLPEQLDDKSDQPPYSWIEEICEIGWPPEGTKIEQAHQAATLVKARDALNWSASPATGATIAFTLMVAGEDRPHHVSLWHRIESLVRSPRRRERIEPDEAAVHQAGLSRPPSRYSLASRAFPHLEVPAARFRVWIRWLVALLFLWLVFTCAMSWNVATGNGYLAQLTAVKADKVDIEKDIDNALNGSHTQGDPTAGGNEKQVGGTAPKSGATTPAQPIHAFCDGPRLLDRLPAKDGGSIPQFHNTAELRLCARQSQNQAALTAANLNVSHWLLGWRWTDVLTRSVCGSDCDTYRHPTDDLAEQRASTLLSILGGAVLPICFGILGAGTAVLRGLSAKMRDSLLAQRDGLLSLVQLALGAVIGACIGLFVTHSGPGASSSAGLLDLPPLSASALCFIAGFGVEEVFLALGSLIRRIFNVPDPSKKPA